MIRAYSGKGGLEAVGHVNIEICDALIGLDALEHT
jgi:enolase